MKTPAYASHKRPSPALQNPATPPSKKLGSLAMVWHHARAYPLQIACAIIGLAIAASATLAIPAGLKRMVDEGFGTGETDALLPLVPLPGTNLLLRLPQLILPAEPANIDRYFFYLFMIVGILALATAVRFYFVSWLGERTIADIRRATQRNLLRQAPAFFEENRPSEIASRMTSDTAIIEQVVGTTISVALRNVVMGIGGTAYLFTLAPKLNRHDAAWYSTDNHADSAAGTAVADDLADKSGQGCRCRRDDHRSSWCDENRARVRAGKPRSRPLCRGGSNAPLQPHAAALLCAPLMTAAVIGLLFSAIVALLWYGAGQVASGAISPGTILAFLFASVLVAGSFGALTEVYGDLIRGAGAASRLNELLNAEPQIKAPTIPVALTEPGRGALTYESVEFRYPTRRDTAALKHFSLSIAPNETVAVVGPSGAGKSTLFQLAQRFYDPDAGRHPDRRCQHP